MSEVHEGGFLCGALSYRAKGTPPNTCDHRSEDHGRVLTLLVQGEKDPFYRLEAMQYVDALPRNGKLVVMEGSGQLPMMARPRDVAKLIDEFFASRLH